MIKLEDKLYTSTEVAQIIGVSLRSVYRYIDDGKLIAEVKTATGRHRFTKQNITDFLYPNGENRPNKTTSTKKEVKPTTEDTQEPVKAEEVGETPKEEEKKEDTESEKKIKNSEEIKSSDSESTVKEEK